MKKILLLIAFVLFAVTSAFAQKKKLGYIDDAYGKASKALDRERPVAYLKPATSGIGVNLTF